MSVLDDLDDELESLLDSVDELELPGDAPALVPPEPIEAVADDPPLQPLPADSWATVLSLLGVVHDVVRREMHLRGDRADDAVQAGTLGLVQAVQRHRAEAGPIEPFARVWIRRTIQASFKREMANRHLLPLKHDADECRGRMLSLSAPASREEDDVDLLATIDGTWDADELFDDAAAELLGEVVEKPVERVLVTAWLAEEPFVIERTALEAGVDRGTVLAARATLLARLTHPSRGAALLTLLGRGDWAARGACRSVDGVNFLSPRGTAAVEVCAGCGVRDECLAFAMRDARLGGCWGGTTRQQRTELRATTRTPRQPMRAKGPCVDCGGTRGGKLLATQVDSGRCRPCYVAWMKANPDELTRRFRSAG